ncbi:MAG: terminase family protein [Patescibacteria group bacterium]
MINEAIIPYKPRNWALKFHNTLVRWIVLIIHRRGGKTTAALNHLVRDALNHPKTRYAYIAPTHKQAKRIVWGMVKEYTAPIDGIRYNEGELLVKFKNGSELMVVGSDNPDSLRGIALWGCFLDEYPLQSPLVFTEIITKCLADHLGYCIFGGTPKGKGHFFRIYQVAQDHPEWCLVYRTIDDSLKYEEGETITRLTQALKDDRELVRTGLMTQDEFDQEWYNSFEAAVKGAVYRAELAKAREEERITKFVAHDPHLLTHTVWDLGINKGNSMSIGWYQKYGNEVRMIDYYENIGQGFAHYIKIVKEKPYIYGKHFAPHDIKVRELGTGVTRYDTAEKLGLTFELDADGKSAVPRVSIDDGIDKARAMFNRIFICAKKCEQFLDFIGMYHYKFDEKKGIFTKEPYHDFSSNGADQFRYAALCEDQMVNEMAVVAPTPTPEVSVKDEFVGQEGYNDGDRHPMFQGVDIGMMGQPKP